jgi:hypothetical protein
VKTIRSVYSEGGIKTVVSRSLKKLMLPVARMGGLIFVECDLRESLLETAELSGVIAREAFTGDAKLFEDPQIFLARLKAGHRCFVGIDSATGRVANYRWISTSAGYIPEIDRYIIVKRGEVYSYDLKTIPEFRRRGIDSYTRNRTYQILREQGFSKVYAYVRADNFPMLRSSRLLLKPIGRVWYVQLRGSKCVVFGERRTGLPELIASSSSADVQIAQCR